MYDHLAVCIKNVEKSYGSNKILRGLSLNVERGSIYGLLGASGCGKTTLLSTITGRIKVDSGEIYIFGKKQLDMSCDTIGYMPQTLSLIGELTVKDTIYFFGRIYNVPEETINRRYTELVELLDLPTDNSYIKNCSGGQKRRVSFAASMVHQPKLLILDEPTVGTDPILRDRVWKYLIKICQEDETTVIITTHYIEETRQANQVGLMREGTILIEESPMKLLSIYGVDNLEEVFLILSTQQERSMIRADDRQSTVSGSVNLGYESTEIDSHELTDITERKVMSIEEEKTAKKTNPTFAWYRFKALLEKNFKKLSRNYGASIFPMLLTFVQVLFFLVAIGRETTDNPFGILNAERSEEFCKSFPINETAIPSGTWDCQINSASCLFEDYLDIPLLKKIHYDSLEKALEDLKNGKIRGLVNIHPNISKLMETRLVEGIDLQNLPDEEIQVYMDMTAIQIGGAIKTKIYNLYEKFHVEIHENCKYLSDAIKLPLRIEETYFGTPDDAYTMFITPGIVTTMIYSMGVLSTCIIILDEKCEGIWDRSIIAGVTALELSMSHLIYQIAYMVIIVLELIVLIFFVFQQPYAGSLWLIFTLLYLQGLAGIVLGFGISIWSTDHLMANVIVSGIFNPLVLASGVMWPIEALNEYLLWVVKFLPLAIPTTALRNVISKGWSLNNLDVLQSLGILFSWIIILLTLNIYLMKRKR